MRGRFNHFIVITLYQNQQYSNIVDTFIFQISKIFEKSTKRLLFIPFFQVYQRYSIVFGDLKCLKLFKNVIFEQTRLLASVSVKKVKKSVYFWPKHVFSSHLQSWNLPGGPFCGPPSHLVRPNWWSLLVSIKISSSILVFLLLP